MVRHGLGSYVGFGEVDTYLTNGVAADITTWFRVSDGDDAIQMETDLVELESITDYEPDIDNVYSGVKRVTGSITLKMTYGYFQNIARWITGHNASPSGAGPFVYAWTPVAPNSSSHYFFGTTERHMVIEVHRGDTSGDSVFYQGCYVTEAQFKMEPNGILEVTLQVIGRGITTGAKSTPVYKDDYMRTPTGQTTGTFLTLGGANYRCYSYTLTISQPLEHLHEVSDQESQVRPMPSGPREAKLDVDVRAPDDDAALMAIIADPKGGVFASNPATLSQDANHILVLTLNQGTLMPGAEARPSSPGEVRCSFQLKGHADGSTPSYVLAITNQDSTYAS